MREKLVIAALIAIVLLMAVLEHEAGRRPSVDAPSFARESPHDSSVPSTREIDDAGVSASPLLTR